MFPNSGITGLDRFLPLAIFAIVATDIALSALAYKFDIVSSVRARAVVEPWTISIAAGVFYFYSARDGLILAYVASLVAALFFALWPLWRSYGAPRGWRPSLTRSLGIAQRNLPLAAADAAEWGSRRLDLAILGLFASPAVVGIYYVAQQVASLPQKLKSSFDPILGPVITRNLQTRNYAEIAAAVGKPDAVRATGSANGANPVSVLIPCHRVIRSDGGLGGYAYGLERKRRLLAWESGQGGLLST
jgi:O-6-methylguanine DNA methyltransferase